MTEQQQASPTRITIKPISRLEGEGKIDIFLDKDGNVDNAYFQTVELRGFGTFEVKLRKGRKRARNPKTGAIVSVEDHGVASFRPGRELKKAAWTIDPSGSEGGDGTGAEFGSPTIRPPTTRP